MGVKILSGCKHKFNYIEGICPFCGTPNPVFRKAIAAAKNHIALIPRNMYDLIVVILTLLGIYGVCGASKAIYYGNPYVCFLLLSFAVVGVVGLIMMFMSIWGNHE